MFLQVDERWFIPHVGQSVAGAIKITEAPPARTATRVFDEIKAGTFVA